MKHVNTVNNYLRVVYTLTCWIFCC